MNFQLSVVVVFASLCLDAGLGMRCRVEDGTRCPTEYDGPEQRFCCGRADDAFGQYCCSADTYARDRGVDADIDYISSGDGDGAFTDHISPVSEEDAFSDDVKMELDGLIATRHDSSESTRQLDQDDVKVGHKHECLVSGSTFSCPTDYDEPHQTFCCGNEDDAIGQYCCSADSYRRRQDVDATSTVERQTLNSGSGDGNDRFPLPATDRPVDNQTISYPQIGTTSTKHVVKVPVRYTDSESTQTVAIQSETKREVLGGGFIQQRLVLFCGVIAGSIVLLVIVSLVCCYFCPSCPLAKRRRVKGTNPSEQDQAKA